jgi:hypothetical protein
MSATNLSFKVCHIPTLPNAAHAKELLDRVVLEFAPIVARRNYNLVSVSEFCCCNDGLDFEKSTRKRRKQSNNLLGYNQSRWGRGKIKSHTIHIRIRHATAHGIFMDYEDVAGTLAHELAHCEVGVSSLQRTEYTILYSCSSIRLNVLFYVVCYLANIGSKLPVDIHRWISHFLLSRWFHCPPVY